jgi:dihydroflavonol-4-reductase
LKIEEYGPAGTIANTPLGKVKNATGEKARRLLGWTPRSNEEVIVATAESLEKRGLLKESTKKAC